MGLFDRFKSTNYTLIEKADFSPDNPTGKMIAYVSGGPGLIKKDRSVDINNLLRILDEVVHSVPEAAKHTDYRVWCGKSVKKDNEEMIIYYDLVKVMADEKSGKLGLGHEDLRNVNGHDGFVFTGLNLGNLKEIKHKWV